MVTGRSHDEGRATHGAEHTRTVRKEWMVAPRRCNVRLAGVELRDDEED